MYCAPLSHFFFLKSSSHQALAEVEANPTTQASRVNMDKGNFRVDVLSRAVRVIKRLNEEVKTEHAEVERLRQQLQGTGFREKPSPVNITATTTSPETATVSKPVSLLFFCHLPPYILSGRCCF